VLRLLGINFTGRIDGERAALFLPLLLRVTSHPRDGSPVRAVPGSTRLLVAGVRFSGAVPGVMFEELARGGVIFVDLACDYLLDTNGRPVSGSASFLLGQREFPLPGGLCRLGIVVEP
jgi:hypothetical protein